MEFKKEMRIVDVFSLALGAIIGWGCFVLPGTSFLPKAGPLGTFLGLSLGGVMVCIIGVCYGYLIEKYPESGGEFIYAYKNLGENTGFVCGWFLLLSYISIIPLNVTAVSLVFKYVLGDILEWGYLYSVYSWDVYLGEVLMSLFLLVLFAFLNIKGVKSAGAFQTFLVGLLVITIVSLTVGMFILGNNPIENLSPAFPSDSSSFTSVIAVMSMAPWAFSGFDCIPQATEEYDFPHKKARILIFLSIFGAVLMYGCITLVTASAYPWEGFLSTGDAWPTGTAVSSVLGTCGICLLVIAMVCAVISGVNGFYISSSRLIYSMSKNKVLPDSLSKISDKGTPKNAIIFIMLVSMTAPWFGREVLGWIVDMCSVGISIAYFITCLVAYRLSRQANIFRIKLFSIFGMIVSFIFLSLLLIPGMPGFLSPQSFIFLIIWSLLGILFYLYKKFRIKI